LGQNEVKSAYHVALPAAANGQGIRLGREVLAQSSDRFLDARHVKLRRGRGTPGAGEVRKLVSRGEMAELEGIGELDGAVTRCRFEAALVASGVAQTTRYIDGHRGWCSFRSLLNGGGITAQVDVLAVFAKLAPGLCVEAANFGSWDANDTVLCGSESCVKERCPTEG